MCEVNVTIEHLYLSSILLVPKVTSFPLTQTLHKHVKFKSFADIKHSWTFKLTNL